MQEAKLEHSNHIWQIFLETKSNTQRPERKKLRARSKIQDAEVKKHVTPGFLRYRDKRTLTV